MNTQPLNLIDLGWEKAAHVNVKRNFQSQAIDKVKKTKRPIGIGLDELLSPFQLDSAKLNEPVVVPKITYKGTLADIFNVEALKPFLLHFFAVAFTFSITFLFGASFILTLCMSFIGCISVVVGQTLTKHTARFTEETFIWKSKSSVIKPLQWGEGKKISLHKFHGGIALIGVKDKKIRAMHIPLKDEEGAYITSQTNKYLTKSIQVVFSDIENVFMIGEKGLWEACGASREYESIKKAAIAKEIGLGSGRLTASCINGQLNVELNGYKLK